MTTAPQHKAIPWLGRLRRTALVVGGVGTLLALAGLFVHVASFFQAYLCAYLFWLGASLGCLALLMLHHLVGGAWGFVIQRLLEAGALTVLLMAVLFVPILFGLHELYHWTHEEAVAESAVLQHKKPYLNVPFFLIRAAFYFLVWGTAALLLRRWSLRLDATSDPSYVRRMRRLGAGGLIAYVLTITFASVDWAMSLEPHWFSTVYGFLVAVSQVLTALALTTVAAVPLSREGSLARAFRTKHLHDIGNFILTFVILWAYMMFAQYLIHWIGNVPEDIHWYVHRTEGAWSWVAVLLILFHFAVPFALLLLRRVKRSRRKLRGLAIALLVAHVAYVLWLILPAFHPLNPNALWIAAAAFVGIGGLWGSVYAWVLEQSALLPGGDPRFRAMPNFPAESTSPS